MNGRESLQAGPVVAKLSVLSQYSGQDDIPVAAQDRGAGSEKFFYLHQGQAFRVGRADGNDLVIDDRNVSRFHAVFSASASGLMLSDLSSLNGTMLNGTRISAPVNLVSGNVVRIGESEIRVAVGLGADQEFDEQAKTQAALLAAVVVTVMVVDVCGYSKISEELPPNDVAEMLRRWFDKVTEVVMRFGGTVDKYIGDCVMAVWLGDHSAPGKSACQAFDAAWQIIRITDELSVADWPYHHRRSWDCRIALNSGEALMGSVGGGAKRDYTVLGDAVNVAFRLEDVAGGLGERLIISEATAALIGAQSTLRDLGKVSIVGRSGRVGIYGSTNALAGREIGLARDVESRVKMLKSKPVISQILALLDSSLPRELTFHSAAHTCDVLAEVVLFAVCDGLSEREIELLAIAAAFHDAGFIRSHESHELLSAEMAEAALSKADGYSKEEIELVRKMIVDTRLHFESAGEQDRASTELSRYLLDADVSNFGRADFFERMTDLSKEVSGSEQRRLFETYKLMSAHTWLTGIACELRQKKKEENLELLRQKLGLGH